MTIDDVIKRGENRTVEFKESLPTAARIAKTAVAFANGAGADIKIAVCDDIVEITSPCFMPGGLTLDDIGSGRSEVRNRMIARIFKEMELIGQWGSGILKNVRIYKEADAPSPEFIENGDCFQIVFPKSSGKASTVAGKGDGVAGRIDVVAGKIVMLLKENPRLTVPDLNEKLGAPKRTIERRMSTLQKLGQLKRVGGRKEGHWEVIDEKNNTGAKDE